MFSSRICLDLAKLPLKRILQMMLRILIGKPVSNLHSRRQVPASCILASHTLSSAALRTFTGKLKFQFHITLESRVQSTLIKEEVHLLEKPRNFPKTSSQEEVGPHFKLASINLTALLSSPQQVANIALDPGDSHLSTFCSWISSQRTNWAPGRGWRTRYAGRFGEPVQLSHLRFIRHAGNSVSWQSVSVNRLPNLDTIFIPLLPILSSPQLDKKSWGFWCMFPDQVGYRVLCSAAILWLSNFLNLFLERIWLTHC